MTKSKVAQFWERLNPFQSMARSGMMRHEPIYAAPDDTSQLHQMETLGDRGWTIVEEDRKPEPFMRNGITESRSALEANSTVKRPAPPTRAIRPSRAALTDDRFQVLQKWEGTVLDVADGALYARLHDLTQDNPDEEVEIELEEVLPDDLALVQPGASFYWCIGHLHKSHGQRIRASELRFRRVPGWTQSDLDEAKKQSQMDGTFFNLDCGESSALHK